MVLVDLSRGLRRRSVQARPIAGILFICLILAAFSANGQPGPPSRLDLPEKVQHGVPAFVFDTRTLPKQIDESLSVMPKRPSNPVQPPDRIEGANDLPYGQIQKYKRVDDSGLWPAVGSTGWYPPDPDLAVGQDHVVVVVNSSIAFFTKTGTKQFQNTAGSFFTGLGAGTFIFDPKCFYDRIHNRYVLVFLEQSDTTETSKLLVAVSDDGDPNGTWYRYRVEAKLVISGAGYWLDYPGFGYNKDAYVVSGNMFGFVSGFGGAQFIVMPSAPMLSGQAMSAYSFRDSGGASVQMAEVIDPLKPYAYGVSRNGSSSMRIYAVSNGGTATPSVSYTNVTVPSNASPAGPAPSTNGQTLPTIDGRVFNALWRGDRLVTGHNSSSGNTVVRWYEFNTASFPASGGVSLVQSGMISSPELHYFTPAINKNALGDISCLFTASSSTVTANIMIAARTASDANGTMGAPTVLQTSAGNNYTQNRWGDYFGVDVDPVDDRTFYGVGETVAGNNSWTTSVFSWTVSSTPVNATPVVTISAPANGSTVTQGTSVTFTGSSNDSEDGNLSSGLTWTSNLQGAIGSGASFSRSDLVVGTHTITARSTDSGGATGSAAITLTVQDPSQPPAAPSGVSAKVVQSGGKTKTFVSVDLTWADNATDETGYEITRCVVTGGKRNSTCQPDSYVRTTGANATSFSDPVKPATGSYRYSVAAVKGTLKSSPVQSNQISVP